MTSTSNHPTKRDEMNTHRTAATHADDSRTLPLACLVVEVLILD